MHLGASVSSSKVQRAARPNPSRKAVLGHSAPGEACCRCLIQLWKRHGAQLLGDLRQLATGHWQLVNWQLASARSFFTPFSAASSPAAKIATVRVTGFAWHRMMKSESNPRSGEIYRSLPETIPQCWASAMVAPSSSPLALKRPRARKASIRCRSNSDSCSPGNRATAATATRRMPSSPLTTANCELQLALGELHRRLNKLNSKSSQVSEPIVDNAIAALARRDSQLVAWPIDGSSLSAPVG